MGLVQSIFLTDFKRFCLKTFTNFIYLTLWENFLLSLRFSHCVDVSDSIQIWVKLQKVRYQMCDWKVLNELIYSSKEIFFFDFKKCGKSYDRGKVKHKFTKCIIQEQEHLFYICVLFLLDLCSPRPTISIMTWAPNWMGVV